MLWSDIDFHPAERKLRTFAGIFVAVTTSLGVWEIVAHGRSLVGSCLLDVAAGVAAVGFLKPSAIRPLYLGMTIATFPIGWLTSRLLLAIVYFGLLTPLAIIFRLIGRDPLRLQPMPGRVSYLKAKSAPPNSQAYFRPF